MSEGQMKTLRYIIILSLLVGFIGGRLSKTKWPTSPEIIHRWEQELRWGRSDSLGPEIRDHRFGSCFQVPSPGEFCVYLDGEQ